MVEQWSSKSHAWVRFLLSLLFFKKTRTNRYNKFYTNKQFNKNSKSFINLKIRNCGERRLKKYSNVFWKYATAFDLTKSTMFSFKKKSGFRKITEYFWSNRRNPSLHFLIYFSPKESSLRLNKNALIGVKWYGRDCNKSWSLFLKNFSHLYSLFETTSLSFCNAHNKSLLFYIYFFHLNKKFTSVNTLRFYNNFLDIFKNLKILNTTTLFDNYGSGVFYESTFRLRFYTGISEALNKKPAPHFEHSLNALVKKLRSKKINPWLCSFFLNQLFCRRASYLLKKKTMLRIIGFKSSLLSYYLRSRLYFFCLNVFNLRAAVNIFKVPDFDVADSTHIRFDRSSKNFNKSDFLFSKNRTSISSYKRSLAILNNLAANDDFFSENTYYLNFVKRGNALLKIGKSANLSFKLDKNYNNGRKTPIFLHFAHSLTDVTGGAFYGNRAGFDYSRLYNKKLSHSFDFFYKCSRLEVALFLLTKPLMFKYMTTLGFNGVLEGPFPRNTLDLFTNGLVDRFFYSAFAPISFNNVAPAGSFVHLLKKKIFKIFDCSKFSNTALPWHYYTLIRFLEYCSGKKVHLRFYPFLDNDLNLYEKAQCLLWAQKVKYFRKVLGPRLFLNESLQIIYLALKLKDPFMLSNWMISTIRKISFWKYKTYLRYLKYVLRYFFWVVFRELGVKGIKFQLKGKISVAGNARTRTAFHNVGSTSHATYENRILYTLSLVRTFTGVQGLKLWIVF